MSLDLILGAIAVAAASGLPSLLAPRRGAAVPAFGQWASTSLILLSSALGLVGAGRGLFEPASAPRSLPWPSVGGSVVGLDPLSAFFLVPIFAIGALAAVYGLGYMPRRANPRTGKRLQAFFGLLLAGMALLVIAKHAFAFLIGWEAMALSAFFLVSLEDYRGESRKAGIVYLVATHIGTLVLFGLFALWRWATGSFELAPAPGLGLGAMNGIFLLSLLGFGLKAGVMPLHFWLPGAHAAAPSQVSALLSGVLLKMGIYGLLRMLSLLPAGPSAWGGMILALGAASALLGVAFAVAQHDIKRLLAYHSVENIGIIMMGLGIALLGRSAGRPEILALGLGGCLLHVWNHSLFKSLLFLGAGSVVRQTGTRRIDRLGGLAKAMPWTAALFVAGAVAICGLPPMNGFASELLVYLGLFGNLARGGAGSAAAAMAAPILAMVGALAVACFVKVCGAAFLGSARSPEAEGKAESPPSMIAPMAVLAGLCALIGLAPSLIAPLLDSVIAGFGVAPTLGAVAPLNIAGIASAAVLALAIALAFALGRRSPRRGASREGATWDCGYARPGPRMQYTASSFARGIVGIFAWALHPSSEPGRLKAIYPEPSSLEVEVEDTVLDGVLLPAHGRLERISLWLHRFQQGLAQKYLLYILIALVLLLLTLVPWSEILALLRMS